MEDVDQLKRKAAQKAIELVQPGMKLGLGTGSTAWHFVDLLGKRVEQGLEVLAVPTSERTREQATKLNIPLTTLNDCPYLDLCVDGADELNDKLDLIKGGGGAHLFEKLVASAARKVVIIADESKYVEQLGSFGLPLEIIPSGLAVCINMLRVVAQSLQIPDEFEQRLNANGSPILSDSGNFLVDWRCGALSKPEALVQILDRVTGLVEHGLFIGMADIAFVAMTDGSVKTIDVIHEAVEI